MTCHSCPTALCYDCFPPHFRRYQPDSRFWADLQKKGWNMNAQKLIMFTCNSCMALTEQQRRQQMRQQALEEKRSFAEKKRKREDEEARRRLRQVMAEHE